MHKALVRQPEFASRKICCLFNSRLPCCRQLRYYYYQIAKGSKRMIRAATAADFDEIYQVINDAATAYKGVIPADRWHEPYMPAAELREQVAAGVAFSCYVENNVILGVMGLQDKKDVYLIRHAYVRTNERQKGIGTLLIKTLVKDIDKPILIGTWKAAVWAIRFYEKNGFTLLAEEEKNRLLRQYWSIPERQVATSVVLADSKYRTSRA
jgi:N-acetylglutamate synthase-like GNAT family acetyltransferase